MSFFSPSKDPVNQTTKTWSSSSSSTSSLDGTDPHQKPDKEHGTKEKDLDDDERTRAAFEKITSLKEILVFKGMERTADRVQIQACINSLQIPSARRQYTKGFSRTEGLSLFSDTSKTPLEKAVDAITDGRRLFKKIKAAMQSKSDAKQTVSVLEVVYILKSIQNRDEQIDTFEFASSVLTLASKLMEQDPISQKIMRFVVMHALRITDEAVWSRLVEDIARIQPVMEELKRRIQEECQPHDAGFSPLDREYRVIVDRYEVLDWLNSDIAMRQNNKRQFLHEGYMVAGRCQFLLKLITTCAFQENQYGECAPPAYYPLNVDHDGLDEVYAAAIHGFYPCYSDFYTWTGRDRQDGFGSEISCLTNEILRGLVSWKCYPMINVDSSYVKFAYCHTHCPAFQHTLRLASFHFKKPHEISHLSSCHFLCGQECDRPDGMLAARFANDSLLYEIGLSENVRHVIPQPSEVRCTILSYVGFVPLFRSHRVTYCVRCMVYVRDELEEMASQMISGHPVGQLRITLEKLHNVPLAPIPPNTEVAVLTNAPRLLDMLKRPEVVQKKSPEKDTEHTKTHSGGIQKSDKPNKKKCLQEQTEDDDETEDDEMENEPTPVFRPPPPPPPPSSKKSHWGLKKRRKE